VPKNRRISSPNATDDTGHSAASAVTGTFLEQPRRPSGETSQASPRALVALLLGNAMGGIAAPLGDGLSNIKLVKVMRLITFLTV
jgi:hypothetical protein